MSTVPTEPESLRQLQRIEDEARSIVEGVRHEDYGPAEREFERVARAWSALFGVEIRPEQVALAMVLLKVFREDFRHKRDNLVDIIGYTLLAHEMLDAEDV